MSVEAAGTIHLPAKVETEGQLREMVESPNNKALIEGKQQSYYTINVAQAMTELVQVGSLLQVAFAASKGHACAESVMKILGNFQTVVHDSSVVSGAFVQACVSSVQSHILARDLAQDASDPEGVETAVEILTECKEIAAKMVKISSELVEKSNVLVKLSQSSLEEATSEEAVGVANREKILQTIAEQKALEANMKVSAEALSTQVAEAKAKEKELADKVDEERGRRFALNILKTIVKPVTAPITAVKDVVAGAFGGGDSGGGAAEADDGTVEALAASERAAAEERQKLQEQQRQVNASLAESVERLKGLGAEDTRIQYAVRSLETVVITMGKVKTTFEAVRQFWMGVHAHCEALESGGPVFKLAKRAATNANIRDRFVKIINSNGFDWAALGKICLVAQGAIVEATNSVDTIMKNLPTQEQVPKLIKSVSTELLEQLTQERKALEAAKKQ